MRPLTRCFGAPSWITTRYFIQGYMVSPQNARTIAVNICMPHFINPGTAILDWRARRAQLRKRGPEAIGRLRNPLLSRIRLERQRGRKQKMDLMQPFRSHRRQHVPKRSGVIRAIPSLLRKRIFWKLYWNTICNEGLPTGLGDRRIPPR
jgi:hypothetical protein